MDNKTGKTLGMKVCPICGKDFFVPDSDVWAYRRCNSERSKASQYKFFCSWTCFRQYEKEHPRKNKSRYDIKEEY